MKGFSQVNFSAFGPTQVTIFDMDSEARSDIAL